MLPQQLRMFNYQAANTEVNLDVYAKAIEGATKSYDTNVTNQNLIDSKLAELEMKATSKDKAYITAIKDKIKNNFDTVATTIQGNKRWDLANNQVNNSVSLMAKDSGLLAINKSYENYEASEKLKLDLRGKGHTPIDLGDGYENHSVINPDGSFKIYQADVQPMANYYKEKDEMVSKIQADVRALPFVSSITDPYTRETQIKEITAERIRKELPNLKQAYSNTDTQRQEKAYFTKQQKALGFDNATIEAMYDEKLTKDFTGIGSLHTYEQRDDKYGTSIEWQNQQSIEAKNREYESKIAVANIKAEAKAKGQPVTGDLLSNQKGVNTNDVNDISMGFNNPVLQQNINRVNKQNPTNNEVLIVGEGKAPFKLEDNERVTKVNYRGFNATNNTGDKNYNGSFLADIQVTDENGKVTNHNAYVVNTNKDFANNFNTTSNIREAQLKVTDRFKRTGVNAAYHVKDESNLIRTVQGKTLTESGIELEIVNRGKGKFGIKPVFEENGKYVAISDADLKYYGLQREYNFDKLVDIATNNTDDYLRTMSTSNKDINKGQGEFDSPETDY